MLESGIWISQIVHITVFNYLSYRSTTEFASTMFRKKNFFKVPHDAVLLNLKVPFSRVRLYHRMTSAENENENTTPTHL